MGTSSSGREAYFIFISALSSLHSQYNVPSPPRVTMTSAPQLSQKYRLPVCAGNLATS